MKPSTIGSYKIIRKLATGGMADVFLAQRKGLGPFVRRFVIKRVHSDLSLDKQVQQMFRDEAITHSLLYHPNISSIFDFGDSPEGLFIATEYLPGQTLEGIIQDSRKHNKPIALHHCLKLIIDILSALSYIHDLSDSRGMPLELVHRDISPSNIIVNKTGSAKILDFGVSKSSIQKNLTATGIIKGKFSYMAPEQLDGSPVDHRADIYAAAACLWEMIAGRPPYLHESIQKTTQQRRFGTLPDISEYRSDVPHPIARMLQRALAPKAGDRFQSARAFSQTCQSLLIDVCASNKNLLDFDQFLSLLSDQANKPHRPNLAAPDRRSRSFGAIDSQMRKRPKKWSKLVASLFYFTISPIWLLGRAILLLRK